MIIHPGWPPGIQAFRERCPTHALQWTRTWAGDGRLALYAGQKCRKLIDQNVLSSRAHAAKRKARPRPELMSRLSRIQQVFKLGFKEGSGPIASPLIKLHVPMFVLKY